MEDKVVKLPKNVRWGKTQTDGAYDWRRGQERRVNRHSRLVVLLKVVLPSFAAVLVGLVILWPQLDAQKEGFSLAAGDADQIGIPEEQSMINPRFFTVDETGQPFNLTARTAHEIPGDVRRVQLDEVKADVLLKNDQWFALDADTAVYSQMDDMLELSGNVHLYSDQGYELETPQAFVNVRTRDIISQRETHSRSSAGHAVSEGFSVSDQGKVIRFLGKTKVTLYSGEGK